MMETHLIKQKEVIELKKWSCSGCGKEIEVNDDYEEENCCDGRMCGCQGREVNPVFCDKCEEKIYGKRVI